MYSYEIENYLKERNYKITPLEFMAIINTSPQIKQVLLENNDAIYTILTDDNYRRNIEIIQEPKELKLKRDGK
jgi:ABC-type uncharacterized transport system substrate-binding protein